MTEQTSTPAVLRDRNRLRDARAWTILAAGALSLGFAVLASTTGLVSAGERGAVSIDRQGD